MKRLKTGKLGGGDEWCSRIYFFLTNQLQHCLSTLLFFQVPNFSWWKSVWITQTEKRTSSTVSTTQSEHFREKTTRLNAVVILYKFNDFLLPLQRTTFRLAQRPYNVLKCSFHLPHTLYPAQLFGFVTKF